MIRTASAALVVLCAPIFATAAPLFHYPVVRHRILPALIVTFAFAALAVRFRAVTRSGAIAGSVVSFLLYVSSGAGSFAGLVTVFLLTLATTRMGYERKRKLGTAEHRHGRRASQVLANLAIATILSIIAGFGFHSEILLLAVVAALAEAAADTVSSESGQALTNRVYLITTFERVPVGTDGGISVVGTLAGVVAAILVSLVCSKADLIPAHWIAAATGAAILGTFADSMLGACLERRGWLNNNAVNFISTALAAGFALIFLL